MGNSHQFAFVLAIICLVPAAWNSQTADEKPGPRAPGDAEIYSPDPNHIWNQIHHGLHVRAVSDRQEFAGDDLDPILWNDSTYLRQGASVESLSNLLDRFLATHAERLIRDPVRRAIFQRELWTIFDQLDQGFSSQLPRPRDLSIKLAQVMRSVALTPEEIAALPDNYQDAVAAKAFPAEHDASHPQRAFLPPDLFREDGPWVVVGNQIMPIAPAHQEAFSRSMFLVFLRLPEGRLQTLTYLHKLSGQVALLYRPPQFPPGTQVALLRRMMLVDSSGSLQLTRLTESLQIRFYRKVPAVTTRSAENAAGEQNFYEFKLGRKLLFQGQSGGLHAMAPDEKEFATFRMIAPYETAALRHCAGCHSGAGIFSFGIDRVFRDSKWLAETNAAIWWKEQRREFGLLQWLWQ